MQDFKDNGVFFGDLTEKNIGQVRVLNEYVFPVSYPQKFYDRLLSKNIKTKLAYQSDVLVGAVSCFPQSKTGEKPESTLYVSILGVLEPYRRQGIGRELFKYVATVATEGNFDSITLHVQTSNKNAQDFYKKFGFEVVETEDEYYKGEIDIKSAHKLVKKAPFKIE